MISDLVVSARDLLGSPGKERPFHGTMPVRLRLGESTIEGPMTIEGRAIGLLDAVRASFTATASASLICTRCLTEWVAEVTAVAEQYFGLTPDEDGYAIVDGEIDVAGPAKDELALAIPAVPLCRSDCRGLCPTCGIDLNNETCDGHGEEPDSPFAILKDLFDS